MSEQIFVSYSRVDTDFVLNLINDLIEQKLDVWLDQRDISAGQRWDRTIQAALQESDIFIIVLSPDSVASENVLDELSFAISAKKRIIPVLYRDCQIPYRIARIQFIDLRTDYQNGFRNLVSEIKREGSGRTIATQKQPGKRRKPIRMFALAAVFLCCVTLIVGGYMLYPSILATDLPFARRPTQPVVQPDAATPAPPPEAPTSTPAPPHAPTFVNTSGETLYDEQQQLITIAPGEQHQLAVMELWSAPLGAQPSCVDAFLLLTWIVRDPYPTAGEDLQLLHPIPMGGGRTEVVATGAQGEQLFGYCDEIYLFNTSLEAYRVEIRYASGLYE